MCTTFIVGDKATVDGSFLVARSADSSALKAQLFIIHPACYYPEGAMYRTKDHNGATDFSYPQPVHAMRYTSVPNWQTKLHGAVGFNEAGLGVTGTESIFAVTTHWPSIRTTKKPVSLKTTSSISFFLAAIPRQKVLSS